MGFINSIQICEICHRTFGPSHPKCSMCLDDFCKHCNHPVRVKCPYQSPLDRLVDLGKTLSVLGLQLKVDILPLGLEHVLLTLLLPDGVLALLDHRLRLRLDGCQGLLIMFHPIVLKEKDVINPLCAEWLWRKNDHSGHGLSQCETMLRCNNRLSLAASIPRMIPENYTNGLA